MSLRRPEGSRKSRYDLVSDFRSKIKSEIELSSPIILLYPGGFKSTSVFEVLGQCTGNDVCLANILSWRMFKERFLVPEEIKFPMEAVSTFYDVCWCLGGSVEESEAVNAVK